jgi:hypothetical protein
MDAQITLELWQATAIAGAYGGAVMWLVRLHSMTSTTASNLARHEEGCSHRYVELGMQRQEDLKRVEQRREEDRLWMTAISNKLDRLVERSG